MTRDANHRAVVDTYERIGCVVHDHTHPGKEPRTTSPGHPDLTVFKPSHETMWYHEVKTEAGKLGDAQMQFIATARECGIRTVVGGVSAALKDLPVLLRQGKEWRREMRL